MGVTYVVLTRFLLQTNTIYSTDSIEKSEKPALYIGKVDTYHKVTREFTFVPRNNTTLCGKRVKLTEGTNKGKTRARRRKTRRERRKRARQSIKEGFIFRVGSRGEEEEEEEEDSRRAQTTHTEASSV